MVAFVVVHQTCKLCKKEYDATWPRTQVKIHHAVLKLCEPCIERVMKENCPGAIPKSLRKKR